MISEDFMLRHRSKFRHARCRRLLLRWTISLTTLTVRGCRHTALLEGITFPKPVFSLPTSTCCTCRNLWTTSWTYGTHHTESRACSQFFETSTMENRLCNSTYQEGAHRVVVIANRDIIFDPAAMHAHAITATRFGDAPVQPCDTLLRSLSVAVCTSLTIAS